MPNIEGNCSQRGAKTIGDEAFAYCYLLGRLTLPSTVTNIGDRAFLEYCDLRKVELNEGLQTIGKCAFKSCTSLEY